MAHPGSKRPARRRRAPLPALALAGAALGFTLGLARNAEAEPILDDDPGLAALAAGYERQQITFARAESGQNFDAIIRPEDRALVEDFFTQGADFQTFSGRHPFEVVESFDEHGDMGNFSGIASVGLAARLMVLRRDGAPADAIAAARAACLRAAESWHVFGTIAGPDTVARGVRRIAPGDGEPPLPGTVPDLVPLADAQGNPLPVEKDDTWRAPVAPGFDGWIWRDNTSKDQVSGYALGVMWLWEALHDDPEAPEEVARALAVDLARFARNLMEVEPGLGLDLIVRDADGRPTAFGDLNARMLGGTDLEPLPEDSPLRNGFNAALGMGVIRAAYHVSGDEEIGRFYYEELIGRREYMRLAAENAGYVWLGEATNYSNVNMLAIALATLGRIESDPYVREDLADLIDAFWDNGGTRSSRSVAQPWFDVIVAGFGRAPQIQVPERMASNLIGHGPAPTFQRDRVNCDEQEIAAGSCIGIDGVTVITIAEIAGHGGSPVATAPLPLTIRPDTNFLWRSDPQELNAGASNRLNPRGDWLAAYWVGRLLDLDPAKNVVDGPPPLPTGTEGEGGSSGGVGGGGGSEGPDMTAAGGGGADSAAAAADDGCGCRLTGARGPSRGAALGALAALIALARPGLRSRRRPGARAR